MHAVERERKLDAPASFALAGCEIDAQPYTLSPATWHRVHTVYYDTPDLRITCWGASLRYRVGEGWTVKLPLPATKRDAFRTEYHFDGDRAVVPRLALDLLAAILRGVVPEPVVDMRTIRTQRAVSAARGDVADIVEDDVRVVEERTVIDRFRQIEIELRPDAPEPVLDDLSRALRDAGAGRPDPQPKILIAVRKRKPEPEVVVPRLDSRSTMRDVVTAAIASSVERLVRIDPLLRSEPAPDSVHDSRVSVRRLRSHLRTFRPVLDAAWADDLRERLNWLSDMLSGARDSDVLLADLRKRVGELPSVDQRHADGFLRPFIDNRAAMYDELSRALRTPRYVEVIDALVTAAHAPRFNAEIDGASRRLAATCMQQVWRRLRKRVRRAGAIPHDRDLHCIRIASKHARYAAEALAPIAGPEAKRFAKRAEALQSLLGEQHDAVTAYHRLRQPDVAQPDTIFIAGEIAGSENVVAQRARRKWRTCWENLERRKNVRFW
jgi:CHAD domain-containing protein